MGDILYWYQLNCGEIALWVTNSLLSSHLTKNPSFGLVTKPAILTAPEDEYHIVTISETSTSKSLVLLKVYSCEAVITKASPALTNPDEPVHQEPPVPFDIAVFISQFLS